MTLMGVRATYRALGTIHIARLGTPSVLRWDLGDSRHYSSWNDTTNFVFWGVNTIDRATSAAVVLFNESHFTGREKQNMSCPPT